MAFNRIFELQIAHPHTGCCLSFFYPREHVADNAERHYKAQGYETEVLSHQLDPFNLKVHEDVRVNLGTVAKEGTVISGTLRPEDLIPAFIKVLRDLPDGSRYAGRIQAAELALGTPALKHRRNIHVDRLQDAINECGTGGLWFGPHPYDGADWGFWAPDDED